MYYCMVKRYFVSAMLCFFLVSKQWCLDWQGQYHQNSYLSVFLCWQVSN